MFGFYLCKARATRTTKQLTQDAVSSTSVLEITGGHRPTKFVKLLTKFTVGFRILTEYFNSFHSS